MVLADACDVHGNPAGWPEAGLNGDRPPLAAGGRDEIVAVMSDQHGAGCVDTPAERSAALVSFLGAGMPSPPSKALIVEALARARRAVAMHRGHGLALDQWLNGEVRLRGIRENAAVLAVLELRLGRREETAQAYRHEHPDRSSALSGLLAALDQPGSAAGLRGVRFRAQADLTARLASAWEFESGPLTMRHAHPVSLPNLEPPLCALAGLRLWAKRPRQRG